MSFAELKEQVAEPPPVERLRLAAFLVELDEQDEPAFQKEVDHRMKAMDEGKKVTMEAFEARHATLRAQSR